ncbi:prephenate dehydrogenase/arogenate dehydrogenase family protein [soil metagenome]
MQTKTKHISIIGFGRFGRLWASLLKSDFQITVCDSSPSALEHAKSLGVEAVSQKDALAAEVIFYCLPISEFAITVALHAPILQTMSNDKLLVDMLSVKMHAKETFEREIDSGIQIMLSHPMFGPDSVEQSGLAGQRIMLEKFRTDDQTFIFWKDYFAKLKLEVIEMTAEEHDKQSASSQALTHLVGRILQKMHLSPSEIDTSNSLKLQEITEQVSRDELQLFLDLQRYNPYTATMRQDFLRAQADLYKLIEDA